jgi:hypothetical protein
MFVPRFEMLIFFAAKATPGDNVIKLSSLSLTAGQNKLERLSMTGPFKPV